MSTFNAPFLTADDIRTALVYAAGTEQPQNDMTARWIRALAATVEHVRHERDQALIRAEAAETELESYRKAERKVSP
ncbi:MAG TPA: hypothetical protein VK735_18745 [Pseudonocardia sp.]|uniref:hypothetical protein n=1 Tax=Pseudonocardia sp. TaxID=60912 RepID=UPI002CF806F5|nr:hypothetical protein [Pseudonocardia sp.]HTF49486.1 hypothetical protein [Pseudonocardia sp.]